MEMKDRALSQSIPPFSHPQLTSTMSEISASIEETKYEPTIPAIYGYDLITELEIATNQSYHSFSSFNSAIRIKLGLKPLKLGPETSSAQVAEDNLKRQREEEAKKAREEAIKNKIAKSKNKRELVKSLPGKGLGEASDGEDDVDDVYKWTQRNKSKEKERQAAAAARREKELQELDEAYQAEYGEEQLSGLRVGHDLDDFGEGEERILTLKDSSILENEEEGDELINIQMSERERLEKNLENKKKKNRPVYSGFDDDEFTGKKKSLLSQYDEVLGTESGNDGFVLGKVSRGPKTGVDRSGSSSGYSGLSAKEIMNQKLKESAIALTYNSTCSPILLRLIVTP